MTTARDVLVLVVAVVLATWQPIERLRRGGWKETPSLPAFVDQSLDPLRRQSHAGERIGFVIPPGNTAYEIAFHCSAQYALAPAVIEPILLRECFPPEPGRSCRRETATRVAIIRPDAASLGFLDRRLGLKPVGWIGPVMLLGSPP